MEKSRYCTIGRGKIEPLGALSVGVLLVATASGIGLAGFSSAVSIAASSHLIPAYYAEILSSGELFNHIFAYFSGSESSLGGTLSTDGGSSVSVGSDNSSAAAVASQRTEGTASISNSAATDVAAASNASCESSAFRITRNEAAALAISGASIAAKEALFRFTL